MTGVRPGGPPVAVVTGGASGIGRAVVAALAAQGTVVVGVDIEPRPAESTASDWVQGDVASEATWTAVLRACDRSGRSGSGPDVLVSNAAIVRVGDVLSLTPADWERTFAVNVFGAVAGMRACLPAMLDRGSGAIVTIASVVASVAEQGLVAYCASKGALLQLTRAVALDYARRGIRANCVCPGVTDTPLFRYHLSHAADPDRFLRVREQRNPLGRLLDPREIAAMVAFLASDAASGITGAAITVDAGLTAGFDFRTGDEGA